MGVVTGGGGGAAPAMFTGASVALNAGTVVNNATTVPFTVVNFDSASFFDAANHQFVIPATMGGVYLVGCMMNGSNGATATFINARIDTSGNSANAQIVCANDLSTTSFTGSGGQIAEYAAGDTLSVTMFVGTVASVTVGGGANGTQFYLQRLGASP